MNWEQLYTERLVSADQALKQIPDGGRGTVLSVGLYGRSQRMVPECGDLPYGLPWK